MNLTTLNPYDAEQCKHIVLSKFDASIEKKFNKWRVNDYRKIHTFDDDIRRRDTPRYSIILCVVPCAAFYYLNYLLEICPENIVDIGCGMNFFKDIIPGLIGIDCTGSEMDLCDVFDNTFSVGHTDQFTCAFSIDALHFIPITEFYNRVMEFANIIQPGGRGYLALNSARMLEHTSNTTRLEIFNTTNPSNEQIANYIDQEINKLQIKWLVIDNLIIEQPDEFIDGNIRLVFEK